MKAKDNPSHLILSAVSQQQQQQQQPQHQHNLNQQNSTISIFNTGNKSNINRRSYSQMDSILTTPVPTSQLNKITFTQSTQQYIHSTPRNSTQFIQQQQQQQQQASSGIPVSSSVLISSQLPNKLEEHAMNRPRIVKSQHSYLRPFNPALGTTQQFQRKQLLDEAIQRKQMQMFLDANKISMENYNNNTNNQLKNRKLAHPNHSLHNMSNNITTHNRHASLKQINTPVAAVGNSTNKNNNTKITTKATIDTPHNIEIPDPGSPAASVSTRANAMNNANSFLRKSSSAFSIQEGNASEFHRNHQQYLQQQQQQQQQQQHQQQQKASITDQALSSLEKGKKTKNKDEKFDDIIKSSVDSDLQCIQILANTNDITLFSLKFHMFCFVTFLIYNLQEYRFSNPRTVELERKGNIQTFIFDKKSQNKLKYSDKSKINTTALPVPKGSISVMLNVARKDYGFNLDNFKTRIPAKSKFKMKWKTIQWLLKNKRDVIKQLFSNYQLMLKFAKNKKEGMDRQEFGELLSYVGLGAETNLGDKLFQQSKLTNRGSIFDDDNSNTVDYKELIIGLEMFKENNIEEKLKVFMELCDTDRNGNISPDELYSILKQNLFTHDDKVKLKGIVREIFHDCDLNKDGVLDKEELLKATSTNTLLLALLNESVKNIKRVDQLIESDLEEPFHCWVPISANFVNYKEGIHFGLVEKLLKAVESIENGYQFRKDTRQQFREARNLGKTQKELELLKEDSLNASFTEDQS